jgi:hypothetical protein
MTKTVTFDETKWKLVPIIPTHRMEKAGQDAFLGCEAGIAHSLFFAYKAMINASPEPEALHVSELPEDVLQRIVTSVVAKENDPEYQVLRESHDRLLILLKDIVLWQGSGVIYDIDLIKQAITEAEKLQDGK